MPSSTYVGNWRRYSIETGRGPGGRKLLLPLGSHQGIDFVDAAEAVSRIAAGALNNALAGRASRPHGLRNNLPSKAADFCLANA